LPESSTATDDTEMGRAPIAVSVRTRFPAASACWKSLPRTSFAADSAVATRYASFTWPRICGSPTTSESRLAATRKRWRTASIPWRR
jgi:hypothetical protein